jgi:hypothetical protein
MVNQLQIKKKHSCENIILFPCLKIRIVTLKFYTIQDNVHPPNNILYINTSMFYFLF